MMYINVSDFQGVLHQFPVNVVSNISKATFLQILMIKIWNYLCMHTRLHVWIPGFMFGGPSTQWCMVVAASCCKGIHRAKLQQTSTETSYVKTNSSEFWGFRLE